MKSTIDHLTFGASTLDHGIAFFKDRLGVTIPQGSKHDLMGTHNCVTRVADGTFLELIAIDPDAPAPPRPRWFTLDEPETTQKLAESPKPLCWVVGTDNLDAIIERSPIDLGEPVLFTRGERSWRLTVPKDGSLPEGGLLPAFIEWSQGPHPSSNMQALGIQLQSINLSHPEPEKLQSLLETLEVDHLARVTYAGQSSLGFSLLLPGNQQVEFG